MNKSKSQGGPDVTVGVPTDSVGKTKKTDKKSKVTKKVTAAKANKKPSAAKVKSLEEPVAKETNVTEAAIDAAAQEQAAILEKRSTEPVATEEQHLTKTTAKAGKRSQKAVKEAEEKQAKEERKAEKASEAANDEPKPAPKVHQRTAEDRLKARGKNYRKVYELIDKSKEYSLKEAIDLAVMTSPVKFDATVEVHVNLDVDPRQADQNIRGNLVLPAGTGKTSRIAVLADADDAAKAKKAGADIAGESEILQSLEKGVIEFDILIATPATMAKLGKYARLLGPKGLMPNPKSGTVTTDVAKAVSEAKAGRIEYRVDSTGIVHVPSGKVSFGSDKLLQNLQTILTSIKTAKPASVKGTYLKSIHITTSMGPSIRVANSEM